MYFRYSRKHGLSHKLVFRYANGCTGKSLLLSGIGASLKRCGEARVVFFDAPPPAAGERLRALQPDVVVFDITTGSPACAIRLWQARAHLLTYWRRSLEGSGTGNFLGSRCKFFESTRQRKSHPENTLLKDTPPLTAGSHSGKGR